MGRGWRSGAAKLALCLLVVAATFQPAPTAAPSTAWSSGSHRRLRPVRTPPLVGATPSPDGSRLLYISAVPVVPADTDIHADVYLWTNGVNELISGSAAGSGPSNNNWVAHASADFSRIYWSTLERLLPEDTDSEEDIYEWTNGTTTMVTSGAPGAPNKSARVSYVTPSASHVFFYTTKHLAPDDTDGETDLYLRSGGVNALAVPGTGSAGVVVTFRIAAQDGSRFWFTTTTGLVPEDTDGAGTSRALGWYDDARFRRGGSRRHQLSPVRRPKGHGTSGSGRGSNSRPRTPTAGGTYSSTHRPAGPDQHRPR